MREQGAEALAFPSIVASGPNGALPHARPTDKPLAAGEFVTLDFGCVWKGYCSDMTRTVFIGRPTDEDRVLYELVLRAQQAGVEAVRPGVVAKDVDATARNIIAEAGYGDFFGHGLGHGIGLDVHEEIPRSAPGKGGAGARHGGQHRARRVFARPRRHPHRGFGGGDGGWLPHSHEIHQELICLPA